jgi:hypothetical protein
MQQLTNAEEQLMEQLELEKAFKRFTRLFQSQNQTQRVATLPDDR